MIDPTNPPWCYDCSVAVRESIQEQITEASALFLSEVLKYRESTDNDLDTVLKVARNQEMLKVWSSIFDICYVVAGGATAVDAFTIDPKDTYFYEEDEE